MIGKKEKVALTIAGSDPTGGAGIQADLRTFHALGVRGISVISALTVQDSLGVREVFPVGPDVFALQLEVLLEKGEVDAVKTGMLLTVANVRAAAALLKKYRPPLLVVDPVLRSSNGVPLLEEEALPVMAEELLPLADVVTPNLPEAVALSGLPQPEGADEEQWTDEMGRAILALGPRSVIIKGGHRSGPPTDLLFTGGECLSFSAPRVEGGLHGSGCLFSSSLLAYLVLGRSLADAVRCAKAYTLERFKEKQ